MKFDIAEFGECVFKHRNITLQIGRSKVSKESGVNESVIRDLENGVSKNPTIGTITGLCNWMNIDINKFIKK